MRKLRLFSAVLSLFLLVPASIIWAQTVSLTGMVYENSMVKFPFSTSRGDIKVYLPDNLTAGSQVHGKVVMEPNGTNDKQLAASLEYLKSLSVIPSVSNTGPLITEPFKITLDEATKKAISDLVFTIPQNADASLPMELRLANDRGTVLFKSEVKFYLDFFLSEGRAKVNSLNLNPYLNAVSKKVITGNEPLVIEPGVDQKTLNDFSFGNELPQVILREAFADLPSSSAQELTLYPWVSSFRQTVVILPPQLSGAFDVFVKYNDGRTYFTDRIYVARLKTTIGKNNLKNNEVTELFVSVEGLENCPWPTQLEIENTTTSTVVLEKGNRQVYDLPAASLTPADRTNQFQMNQQVIGERPGIFNIRIRLHSPVAAFSNDFQHQVQALSTLADFNGWANACKEDIKSLALMQPNTDEGKKARSFTNQIADEIRYVNNEELLDEAKSKVLAQIKHINLPESFSADARCTHQAYKTACRSASNTASGKPVPIYWDLIQNGLSLIQQKSQSPEMKKEVQETREIVSRFQKGTEPKEKLAGLTERLKEINHQSEKEDTNVHVEYGRYKSDYLPPGYTHLKGGPEKTLYSPFPMKHIEAGPKESWYVPESYVHVDSGYDKSNYISPLVRHVAEAGPENSNYVAKDWVHWKTGPSRSYYFPKTIRHIDTGMHKSKIEYDVPGVDKPIREWEFQQKKSSRRKPMFPDHFLYSGYRQSAKLPDNLFFTNEQFIRNLANPGQKINYKKFRNHSGILQDATNAKEVLVYVLDNLPDEVTIFPSENYYYFLFSTKDRLYKGSLSLFAHNRDEGILDIGYIEMKDSRWKYFNAAPSGGSAVVSAKDGFLLKKKDDFRYSLDYNRREIIFNLRHQELTKPVKPKLDDCEIYAGSSFDESGLEFFLVYNSAAKQLFWLLNEDKYVPEKFSPGSDNIIIGERTAFAFYDDKENQRKILIGVRGENVLQNNWYDGPFDQLPDNYVYTGQLEIQNYLEQSYPGTKGRIDKYGHYLDEKGARIAVAPYLVYFSMKELINRVKNCEQLFAATSGKCACLTKQEYKIPDNFLSMTEK